MADLSENIWNLAPQPLKTFNSTTIMLMTTKLDRVVTSREILGANKSHDALITWSREIMWQTKNISTRVPIATKLGRIATWGHGLLLIKSHENLWSWMITWQIKITSPLPWSLCPSFSTRKVAWNLDDVVTYYKVTWQTKAIITTLPQCLWPPSMGGWWIILRGVYP